MASFIDHTLLKPEATPEQIIKLCEEAAEWGFVSVCVNPLYVRLAAEKLAGSTVKVCTVIGFPLGASAPALKVIEAANALTDGATEVDMVLPIGQLKSGDYMSVYEDIRGVVRVADGKAIVKVILETALLAEEEKIAACLLAKTAGADFVETSTGFCGGGAIVEDIILMRTAVGPTMGVKASGAIKNNKDARAMLAAGATRIGTSSSVDIIQGEP
ncbi:deoxyribose-phosphate aldolase [Paenibacillus aestuarii]|uniref:Deoxyribose-phosphate aldolase n=1 Tax=Paenibacillus aestuarii TaxID=516965 RepID=A0ABW0KB71_9BACL|nr:deoxyribose-phosphate aldolase [Paenibacillus aestuarii]